MGAEAALIFTYGTLKQGFPNHGLLEEMIATGDATFIGCYRTRDNLPLVCGPYRVPFLLNLPGCGHRVSGELYTVSPRALARMDELEGLSDGHYERLQIHLQGEGEDEKAVTAMAYYGHRSYAEALWRRNREEGYEFYSEKVALGYVRRKDRPGDLSFLDLIRLFISASDSSTNPEPILSCS